MMHLEYSMCDQLGILFCSFVQVFYVMGPLEKGYNYYKGQKENKKNVQRITALFSLLPATVLIGSGLGQGVNINLLRRSEVDSSQKDNQKILKALAVLIV
jgi:hypothetical protein